MTYSQNDLKHGEFYVVRLHGDEGAVLRGITAVGQYSAPDRQFGLLYDFHLHVVPIEWVLEVTAIITVSPSHTQMQPYQMNQVDSQIWSAAFSHALIANGIMRQRALEMASDQRFEDFRSLTPEVAAFIVAGMTLLEDRIDEIRR